MQKRKTTLAAEAIIKIISAGKDANCAKITYNGLTVEYKGQPSPEVAHFNWNIDTPVVPDTSSNEIEISKQLNDANELDQLMILDPLEYERRIQEVDVNAKR